MPLQPTSTGAGWMWCCACCGLQMKFGVSLGCVTPSGFAQKVKSVVEMFGTREPDRTLTATASEIWDALYAIADHTDAIGAPGTFSCIHGGTRAMGVGLSNELPSLFDHVVREHTRCCCGAIHLNNTENARAILFPVVQCDEALPSVQEIVNTANASQVSESEFCEVCNQFAVRTRAIDNPATIIRVSGDGRFRWPLDPSQVIQFGSCTYQLVGATVSAAGHFVALAHTPLGLCYYDDMENSGAVRAATTADVEHYERNPKLLYFVKL